MKKVFLFMLCLIFFSNQAFAKDIKKSGISLSSDEGDGLVCMFIDKNTYILPDFGEIKNLKIIEVEGENPYYMSIEGVLYSKDGKTLIRYPEKKRDSFFEIPDAVTYIMSGAFSNNRELERVHISRALEKIGANPFAGCRYLSEITVSEQNPFFSSAEGLLYDKDRTVLYSCPNRISEPRLPEGLRKIAYAAFSGCRRMRKISIPDSVSRIESMAFEQCSLLCEFVIPKNAEAVNISAFTGCEGLEEIYSNSDYFTSVDGILYSYDLQDLICCPAGKSGRVNISEGVINVLNGAFDGCDKITGVVFPESIKNVSRAFASCTELKSIELPQSQAIVEYGSFSGCTKLEWVYLPNNIVIVQDGAFEGSNPVICCDEFSFARVFAEENGFDFEYMYHVMYNGKKIHMDTRPFEEDNEVYIPLYEAIPLIGGRVHIDYSTRAITAVLGEVEAELAGMRVFKAHNRETQVLDGVDVRYLGEEVYISADDFAEIFELEMNFEGYTVEFMGN